MNGRANGSHTTTVTNGAHATAPTNGAQAGGRPMSMMEARASAKAPRSLGEWGRTFTALSERDYAIYFGGNLAFFMAMQMNQLLRGYLAFELTNAASALGLVALGIALPMLFVSPFGRGDRGPLQQAHAAALHAVDRWPWRTRCWRC